MEQNTSFKQLPEKSSIDYRFILKRNVFVGVASGNLTYGDLLKHVIELMSDTKFRAGINGIYDFTQVNNVSGLHEQWDTVASSMSSDAVIVKPAATAIICSSQYTQTISVMEEYLGMTKDSPINYAVFMENQWPQAMAHVELPGFTHLDELVASVL
ncbi:MAG: hypothetical protein GJ680_02850 [Alteromonadaceae bacterium]|nr:hypothetical protein [Alteromonadaceae bacterium]